MELVERDADVGVRDAEGLGLETWQRRRDGNW
jgi:hypothetical protein